MASGHPIYMDFVPKSIYPFDNQKTDYISQTYNTELPDHHSALEPNVIETGARPIQGPFAAAAYGGGVDGMNEFLQGLIFYPVANRNLYLIPGQPVRRDYYEQLVQKARSPGYQVSGDAPTYGVYTGYQGHQYAGEEF